jgi:ribosomal protein S27E
MARVVVRVECDCGKVIVADFPHGVNEVKCPHCDRTITWKELMSNS